MRVAPIAVGAALLGASGSAAAVRSSTLKGAFRSTSEGVAVRYPAAWRLTTVNHSYVPDPALCFDLAPASNAKVDVRVVEYLPPYFNTHDLHLYPPRPRRFSLADLRKADEDWSSLGAKTLSFREYHRVFFVGVALPATATQATRHTIELVLDSLRITPHGRCRPTAGVGSTGIPSPKRSSAR